jgi:hypothetical protein
MAELPDSSGRSGRRGRLAPREWRRSRSQNALSRQAAEQSTCRVTLCLRRRRSGADPPKPKRFRGTTSPFAARAGRTAPSAIKNLHTRVDRAATIIQICRTAWLFDYREAAQTDSRTRLLPCTSAAIAHEQTCRFRHRKKACIAEPVRHQLTRHRMPRSFAARCGRGFPAPMRRDLGGEHDGHLTSLQLRRRITTFRGASLVDRSRSGTGALVRERRGR